MWEFLQDFFTGWTPGEKIIVVGIVCLFIVCLYWVTSAYNTVVDLVWIKINQEKKYDTTNNELDKT